MRIVWLVAVLACAHAGFAQNWEGGGAAGAGFSPNLTVTNPLGKASTGFASMAAFGGWLGQSLHDSFGGEVRYTFRPSGLRISSGGSQAKFQGFSHMVHYDVLFYTKPPGPHVRPFLAAGAGMRVFHGTGTEAPYQPLQEFALLTRTREWKPLVTAGVGIRAELGPRMFLRVEIRDYITPFPQEVIAPAKGSKISGWLHDIVPLAGIGFVF